MEAAVCFSELRNSKRGHFVPDGEWCEVFHRRRATLRGDLCYQGPGGGAMVLTQGWVNAVSIGIVGVAVARLWKWPSWWNRYRAHRKSGGVG